MYSERDIFMAITIARDQFGLTLPITMEELRHSYSWRRGKLKSEMWVSCKNRNKLLRLQIRTEYEELIKALDNDFANLASQLGGPNRIFDQAEEYLAKTLPTRTVEGIPTWILGLALELNPASKQDCEACRCKKDGKSKGYTVHYAKSYLGYCEHCFGEGCVTRTSECTSCNRGGWYQQESGRIVECRRCHGTKLRKHSAAKMVCPECKGKRKVQRDDRTSVFYEVCYNCSGQGATEVPCFIGYENEERQAPAQQSALLLKYA